MYSTKYLEQRFGLTKNQVRHRLDHLKGVLNGHIRVESNKKYLTKEGLRLFENLIKYEQAGMNGPKAVQLIKTTLAPEKEDKHVSQDERQVSLLKKEIDELRQRNFKLIEKIGYLEDQLSYKQSEINSLQKLANGDTFSSSNGGRRLFRKLFQRW